MASFPDFLLEGHRQYRGGAYQGQQDTLKTLAIEGQTPKVLVVGCVDSRVNPNEIFNAGPGELFIVRNVANLVPAFQSPQELSEVSAALEFGVMHLNVSHIVVLGHTGCGGIKAMLDPATASHPQMQHIHSWVSQMGETCEQVKAEMAGASADEQVAKLEQRSVQSSLLNLETFPFIRARRDEGRLDLHGAVFNVEHGMLEVLTPETGSFSAACG